MPYAMDEMVKKVETRQVNARIPEVLAKRFADFTDSCGSSQRAMSAAIAAFLELDVETQWQWLRKSWQLYFNPGSSDASARSVAELETIAKAHQPQPPRPRTEERPATRQRARA